MAILAKKKRLVASMVRPVGLATRVPDEEQVTAEPQHCKHVQQKLSQGITEYINGILPDITNPWVREKARPKRLLLVV